jgi:hypothetical protein
MRFRRIRFLLAYFVLFVLPVVGQSPNGNINGQVLDQASRAIPGAEIVAVNDVTGVKYATKASSEGIYVLPNLPPGPYRLQVSNLGFKTMIKPDIVLNVQDALSINFTLPIGAVMETITVEGGAPLVNTQSASVGTVIDRQFVANLPLNGRSFNILLQLTPGVVLAQSPNSVTSPGQFSVAGQRTDANNFTVDGVSANFGVSPTTNGESGTGSSQAFSILGGTSSLVSVEALQEFRVETSSFAPEFGRSPGGQVVMLTRSGTNDFHGGLYEYFRNTVMDANDWFADHQGQPKAPEQHNDFGGFLGGPILRDKTFFFVSYEGVRLRLPRTSVIQVPSLFARSSAPAAIAPFLNAFPQPNGSAVPGQYTASFTGTFSNLANLNAGSVRIDHALNRKASIFVRYSNAPSELTDRINSLSQREAVTVDTKTITAGVNLFLSNRVSDTVRANYSTQKTSASQSLDSFGGAIPVNTDLFFGPATSNNNNLAIFLPLDATFYQIGPQARNRTKQVNITDDLSVNVGKHQLKFGGDYRAIWLATNPFEHSLQLLALSVQSFVTNQNAIVASSTQLPVRLRTQSASFYGQDAWKISPKLTMTYGVRWELSPAPAAVGSTRIAAWENINDPANIALAPPGTPIWKLRTASVAPRIGIAYSPRPEGDLVLRAGWGIFYDLGVGQAALLSSSFPNRATRSSVNVAVPVADATPYLPVLSTTPPFAGSVFAFAPDLAVPRSFQWNAAVEKGWGKRSALSITYVGQAGRELLRNEALFRPNPNFTGTFQVTENDARSNYDALQAQFRRPLANGLQILLNYTFSHSLDNASNDVVAGLSNTVISSRSNYASSDFDVRHSFSGAFTYEIPGVPIKSPISWLTRRWSVDGIVVARSGFPFNAQISQPSLNGGAAFVRPDLVPGEPVWLASPSSPGGKRLNKNAFLIPPTVRQGTEGRNDIRGFGLTQIDLSVRRKFPIKDRLNLEFRADAFNVLNHPNFTNPQGFIAFGPAFLESQSMLNEGLGGLNPLFQQGGPRSLQLSLKLSF